MTRPPSRAEQKERTRQEILDRALELATDRTFASLSLREIARAANLVPTALYRHFSSLEQIGLNLVDDGVRSIRPMLRDARRTEGSIDKSVDVLFTHVRDNRDLFRFLHRERFSGSGQVQRAIEMEIRLIASELTIDLSRNKHLQDWKADDLDMAANLVVTAVLDAIMSFINAEQFGTRAEEAIVGRTKQQLRLILAGMAAWRPHTD